MISSNARGDDKVQMVFRDQLAKTLSRIAQVLKVSGADEKMFVRIVRVIREHFHGESSSLYERRNGELILVAHDHQKHSPQGRETPESSIEISLKKKKSFFDQETAVVPLIYQEKIVGLLSLQRNQMNGFDLQEKNFLEFIALQLAGPIQALRISDRLKKEIKEGQVPLVFSGIAVSPGFGIGPALFLHTGIALVNKVHDYSPLSIKIEWSKIQHALGKTVEDLKAVGKYVEDGESESSGKSTIFETHEMILSDIDFFGKLKKEVDEGKSALESIENVFLIYQDHFSVMKNSHFAELATDLEELKQRLFENLLGIESRQEKEDWTGVLVAKSLGPSDTVRLDTSKLLGIVTMTGGSASHAAILARSLGIPAVMGVADIIEKISPGALIVLDGDKGEVIVNPTPDIIRDFELLEQKRVAKSVALSVIAYEPTMTQDGHLIHLQANLGFASDVKNIHYLGAEGVGLFRTEFLFLRGKNLPDENEQLEIYKKILQEAGDMPVTFRILDAGGDKPIEALPMEKEANPFLGHRSLRLLLAHPYLLKTQFRALLRASVFGKIRLLIPMVSGVEEIDAVKGILETAQKELLDEGVEYDLGIPLGIMIEVPTAVSMASILIKYVDFFSIGTNDLTQYSLAVDRDNERVASFFEPLHPGVLIFISQIAAVGVAAQKPVSLCGEMASYPLIIPLLVGFGINTLSMTPSSILEAKKVIRDLNYQKAKQMAQNVLKAHRIKEVRVILESFQASMSA